MKGELPLSVWGLRGEGIELFGRREALVSGLHLGPLVANGRK
jgi:hypothetical protein